MIAECMWRNSYGTQDAYDNHNIMLNAAIAQKFFQNRLEFKISGNDLLNQNRSLFQSVNDTYIQVSTSSVIKRYFMASLMWKFDTRKDKKSLTDAASRRSDRMNNMAGRWE